MAHANLDTILDLWAKCKDTFTAKKEAIGGLSLSGTSLVETSVSGDETGYVELGNTFARRSQAAAQVTVSCDANRVTVSLYDGDGNLISSDYDFVTE